MSEDAKFKTRVYRVVESIPYGRVMTYSQIAVMAGSPRAARVVGQIAHFGDENLPWHRVVNYKGGLARGFSYGGVEAHRKMLEDEKIKVVNNTVDLGKYLWKD